MSESLESKAKTTREVYALLGGTKDPDGQRKWVSLEEAQKLEKETVACLERDNSIANGRIQELEKQIADANKILDEFENEMDIIEMGNLLRRLRVCLKGVG